MRLVMRNKAALPLVFALLACGSQAPVWEEIPDVALSPGGSATLDLDDYVSDPDGSDELLLMVVYGGSTSTVSASIDAATHALTLKAAATFRGSVEFTVTATDPDGNTATATVLAVSGSGPEPVVRSCLTRFTYDARGGGVSSVAVAGQFNGWSTSALPMSDPDGDKIYTADATLAEGYHQYKLVLNGSTWITDPDNPYQAWEGGFVNSEVRVPDCEDPDVQILSLGLKSGRLEGAFQYVQGKSQGSYPASGAFEVKVAGSSVSLSYDASTGQASFSVPAAAAGKYTTTVRAIGASGRSSQTYVRPLWVEERSFDWREAVAYFAMTDRFNNGATSNDAKLSGVADIANYQGGDWQGITAKLEAGYFNDLGVDVLWLSPIRDNPEHSEKGGDGRNYSGYHGYWPQDNTLEEHFGGAPALLSLVKAAHDRGIRVMLDLVGNHVHDEHAWYSGNPGWYNPYDWCNDGGSWDTNPLGCWFMDYLPDLNYQVPDAAHAMADLTMDLMRTYDLDAVRVDAVKHMEMVFTTRLVADVEGQLEPSGVEVYTVGETFVGTWDYSATPNDTYAAPQELIARYVGEGLLDGQFDFPLYWEVVKTFARNEQGFSSLNAMVEDAEGYYGPDALMSTFLGNHDVPRFVSHANGDIADMWGNGAQEQGWTNPPAQPTAAAPYERLRMAFTFLMTMPGVPLIYYGDEVGLAGAGDPDNRRFMPWSGLNAEQDKTRAHVQALGGLRDEHQALSTGARTTLLADTDGYAYGRSLPTDKVVVAMNKGSSSRTMTLTVSGMGLSDGATLTDALSGGTVTVSGGKITVTLPARGSAVYTSN